jgi:hypothetical protein
MLSSQPLPGYSFEQRTDRVQFLEKRRVVGSLRDRTILMTSTRPSEIQSQLTDHIDTMLKYIVASVENFLGLNLFVLEGEIELIEATLETTISASRRVEEHLRKLQRKIQVRPRLTLGCATPKTPCTPVPSSGWLF